MQRATIQLAMVLALGASACGFTGPDDTTVGPSIGKADASDFADRECQIVLRSVDYDVTHSQDDWLVWIGTIDVATDAGSTDVGVMYSTDGDHWAEVSATATTGAPAGFRRYRFRMYDGIYKSGSGSWAWTHLHIRLIPVLHLDDGSRLFDHNRIDDDQGTYELSDAANRLELADDAEVCPGGDSTTEDLADHSCRVVLRTVSYDVNDYQDDYLVWTAVVDVRKTLAASSTAALQYASDGGSWHSVPGVAVSGAPTGYQRYRMRLWEGIYRGGTGGNAWDRLRLELIPTLRLSNGDRLFDHNRVDDNTNYVLTEASNQLELGDDPDVCH